MDDLPFLVVVPVSSGIRVLPVADLVQLRCPLVQPVDLSPLQALIERALDTFAGGRIGGAGRVRRKVPFGRFHDGVGNGARGIRSTVGRHEAARRFSGRVP